MGVSIGAAIVGATTAFKIYSKSSEGAQKLTNTIKPVYKLVSNKYYVDQVYEVAVINPVVKCSKNLWKHFDSKVIDGVPKALGDIATGMGSFSRSLQTGNMQQYAMYIGIGIVVILSYVIMR
jgi:NADH-quinone oxidoreductase subunit L